MSLARKLKRRDVIPQSTAKKLYAQGQLQGVRNMEQGTREKLTEAYNMGFNEASAKAHVWMAIMSIAVLHSKFGWGEKRAKQFSEELEKLTDAVNKGEVSTVEIIEELSTTGKMKFLLKSKVDDGAGHDYIVDWRDQIEEERKRRAERDKRAGDSKCS
jgi:hypothetical protein